MNKKVMIFSALLFLAAALSAESFVSIGGGYSFNSAKLEILNYEETYLANCPGAVVTGYFGANLGLLAEVFIGFPTEVTIESTIGDSDTDLDSALMIDGTIGLGIMGGTNIKYIIGGGLHIINCNLEISGFGSVWRPRDKDPGRSGRLDRERGTPGRIGPGCLANRTQSS